MFIPSMMVYDGARSAVDETKWTRSSQNRHPMVGQATPQCCKMMHYIQILLQSKTFGSPLKIASKVQYCRTSYTLRIYMQSIFNKST
jgi:hypothetical protein